jgi:hypothetical protein
MSIWTYPKTRLVRNQAHAEGGRNGLPHWTVLGLGANGSWYWVGCIQATNQGTFKPSIGRGYRMAVESREDAIDCVLRADEARQREVQP